MDRLLERNLSESDECAHDTKGRYFADLSGTNAAQVEEKTVDLRSSCRKSGCA